MGASCYCLTRDTLQILSPAAFEEAAGRVALATASTTSRYGLGGAAH